MIKEFEEQKQARKLAKKEKRKAGRKKRLQRWGTVFFCVLIFIVATIWGVVQFSKGAADTLADYQRLIDALSETVDIGDIVTDRIAASDYNSFISKCNSAGINIIVNQKLNTGDLTMTDEVTFSGNELGAYINESLEGEEKVFEILEVSLYRSGETDYIKTISKINISEVDEELSGKKGVPASIYLTTISELYRYHNRLELRNSRNIINKLTDENNDFIFNALMSDEFEAVDGIMNSAFVEKVNDFITHTGAALSYSIAENVIELKFTPST